jgi:hypothetical protein
VFGEWGRKIVKQIVMRMILRCLNRLIHRLSRNVMAGKRNLVEERAGEGSRNKDWY